MNPTNTQDQTTKQNKNFMPVVIVALVFVFVILISLVGIYLLTRQKVTTGPKPPDVTQVGAGRVNGPEVSIRKQGDSYVVDSQMPIVMQTNEEGVNFKNNTDITIGVFVPVLQDFGNIKIPPGATEGFSLKSLRRDSTVCVGNEKCNQFEFLGSVYPALFKGTIEIVSANTVTKTPTPTPTIPTTTVTSAAPSGSQDRTDGFNFTVNASNENSTIVCDSSSPQRCTCTQGDPNCYYNAFVQVTNNLNERVFEASFWGEANGGELKYYDSGSYISAPEKVDLGMTEAKEQMMNNAITIRPPSSVGQSTRSTLYVSGKTCFAYPPSGANCVPYGTSSYSLPEITLLPAVSPTTPISNATIFPTQGAELSSQVNIYVKYVTGSGNAAAVNSPVKLVLKDTGETIAYGYTNNDGKSPTWLIKRDTQLVAYAYSPTDFTTVYCGNSVEFNTGSYGTTQNKNITLNAPGSSPCLTQ